MKRKSDVWSWLKNRTSGKICQVTKSQGEWRWVTYEGSRRESKFHFSQLETGFDSILQPRKR